MKQKTITSIIASIIVVTGIIYLFLVYAVDTKNKEFQDFKKKIAQDSASYHSTHKKDTTKAP